MTAISNLSKIGGALLAFGGIVYEMGRQSQKLGDIIPTVYAMELDQKDQHLTMAKIYTKVSLIEEKVIHIEKEIDYIRNNIK